MVPTEQNANTDWFGGQAIRLLMVSGNREETLLLQRMVNTHQLRAQEIWTASTGQDGLELFSVAQPDCILLDYLLPDMTGLAFLDRLAMPDGTLPTAVVMLTEVTDSNIVIEAMKRGSLDYVSKSHLSTEHLHRAISNAMEKARLRIQLRRRHDELAQFVSKASRKIRTPLRTASRNGRALRDLAEEAAATDEGSINPQRLRQHLDALCGAIASAEDLLEAVDTYSHFIRRPVALEQVDMQNLIEAVLLDLHALIEQTDAAISLDPLPTLLGDENSLRHLLRNLLKNSLESPRDVSLRISISAVLRGHQWQITIEDNGKGIPASLIPHIFEPFYKPAAATGNQKAGMGLAICERIVAHHGGSIWIKSKLDRGTSVHFLLPQIGYRPAVDVAARPIGEEWSKAS